MPVQAIAACRARRGSLEQSSSAAADTNYLRLHANLRKPTTSDYGRSRALNEVCLRAQPEASYLRRTQSYSDIHSARSCPCCCVHRNHQLSSGRPLNCTCSDKTLGAAEMYHCIDHSKGIHSESHSDHENMNLITEYCTAMNIIQSKESSSRNYSEKLPTLNEQHQCRNYSELPRKYSDAGISITPQPVSNVRSSKSNENEDSFCCTNHGTTDDALVCSKQSHPSDRSLPSNACSSELDNNQFCMDVERKLSEESTCRESNSDTVLKNTVCVQQGTGGSSQQKVDIDFQAPIMGYEILEPRTRFTVFQILVQQQSSHQQWFVHRRYTDFVRLNKKLTEAFKGVRLSLPPKRWFLNNFDPIFLEDRLLGLQAFLNNIIAHKSLQQHPAVADFLCLKEQPPSSECRVPNLLRCCLPDPAANCPALLIAGSTESMAQLVHDRPQLTGGSSDDSWCCSEPRAAIRLDGDSASALLHQRLLRTEQQLSQLMSKQSQLVDALRSECALVEQAGLQQSSIHALNIDVLRRFDQFASGRPAALDTSVPPNCCSPGSVTTDSGVGCD